MFGLRVNGIGVYRFPLWVPFHLKQRWRALLLAVSWPLIWIWLHILNRYRRHFPILLYPFLNRLLNWLIWTISYIQFCPAKLWLLFVCWSTIAAVPQAVLQNQWLYMLSMLHLREVIAICPVLDKVIDCHLLYPGLFVQVSAFKVFWVFLLRGYVFISDAQLILILNEAALVWVILLWDEKRIWF